MLLTIKKALNLSSLADVKVVAGWEKLDNQIRWVHVGESINMAEWLRGGELLLTCAHGIKNNQDAQKKFIKGLVEIGISALGIEPGYYFNTIPDFLKNEANRHNLPLLEIPKGRPFIDITKEIIDKIVDLSDNKPEFYLAFSGSMSLKTLINKRLADTMKLRLYEEADRILDEIFELIKNENINEVQIKYYLQEIMAVIIYSALEEGVVLNKLFRLKNICILNIKALHSFSEKYRAIKRVFRKIILLISENREKEFNRPIYETIKYLHENYHKKITLEKLSDVACLSNSYLSKLFKEELDKTIFEYLTELRIGKAKRELIYSNSNLQNVAELVGYDDASYFSKVFKKEEGISPSEFRSLIK